MTSFPTFPRQETVFLRGLRLFLTATVRAATLFLALLVLLPSAQADRAKRQASMENLKPTQPWPPAFMAQLPKDYLDRVRLALLAGASHGDKFQLAAALKSAPNNNLSVGWIHWGLAGLTLGIRADDINTFIASPSFVMLPHQEFAFGFFGTGMLQFYALFNSHSPSMPGRLTPQAQSNLEKNIWNIAKPCKLADARLSPWVIHGSQNHSLMEMGGELLAAQFLRKVPAYAHQKYDDGTDLETMYQAWNTRMNAWFDTRARAGLFTEWGSPSYDSDIAGVVRNMRDFADDLMLRKKAEMFLNLYFAAAAEDTIAMARGGAKMRTKGSHYVEPFLDRTYDLLFNAPGRTFEPLSANPSSYYPPAAVVNLAHDVTQRGPYSILKRITGVVADGKGNDSESEDNVRLISAEHSLPFYDYATPHYVVGSNYWNTKWSYASAGNAFQGAVFDGNETARIAFYMKPTSLNDFHLFEGYVAAQDRNVLVVQKWLPSPPNSPKCNPACLQVYFSATLDSVSEDNSGWIFSRSGHCYAAVKVVKGGYAWNQKWAHADAPTVAHYMITLKEDVPVIVVVNDASDYGGDFAAFQKAVKAQPISYENGTLEFATLKFSGTKDLPQVNGQAINLAPTRLFDSPFIRSDWNSGLIFIHKGDATLKLDFSDVNHPIQTEGLVADAKGFPPGQGSQEPIVFRVPGH